MKQSERTTRLLFLARAIDGMNSMSDASPKALKDASDEYNSLLAEDAEELLGGFVVKHEVVSLPSTSGKTPHVILKEFVAERLNTNEFDESFAKAYELGKTHGTAAYDEAIEIILGETGISIEDALNALRQQGVKV